MTDKLLDLGVDDNLRAMLLHAVMAILARSRDVCLSAGITLVQRLAEEAAGLTVHQSARVLWTYRNALQSDIVATLLQILAGIDPANKAVVNELDLGLQSLLVLGYDEAAISYVTQMLSPLGCGLKLHEFDSFTRELVSGPPDRLSRVVVRWLLLGAPHLCEGLANALEGSGLDGPPLNLHADDLQISPVAQIFICRKALGWFFLKPTTAASILVSVLRVCNAATALEVQKLLVEELLINYGGVRDYLDTISPDDIVKIRVDQSLSKNQAYIDALREISIIKELVPSEHRCRIQRLRISDQMQRAHKEAQNKSALFGLMSKSVLLYGNRSLSFIKKETGGLQPLEMELHSHEISYEMPRMEVVDPVGLDLRLRIFRGEKMK